MAIFDGKAIATVVVGLLAILAIAIGAEAYVQQSSDAAFAEFVTANTSSASEAVHPEDLAVAQPDKTQSGCPAGKRKLPTQLKPLP